MKDNLVNDKSFRLQSTLSKQDITCLPNGFKTNNYRSFNKHQRFKVLNGKGRVEEPFINSTSEAPFIQSSDDLKDISMKKQELLSTWTQLIDIERALKATEEQKQRDMERKETKYDSSLRIEPSWLAQDKQVLRFKLFFKEELPPPNKEKLRIRRCFLLYYLSNSQLEIKEEKEENSGIVQGAFLKPMKLLKTNGEPYTPTDFVIGETIEVLNRQFFCYGADEFTREYYKTHGMSISDDLECPLDDYHKLLKQRKLEEKEARKIQQELAKSKKRPDNLQQYLDNDRKVLRFYCVWDDNRQYGLKNRYALHFFLSDDTVEIRNLDCGKDGKESFPLMYKRQKLPKSLTDSSMGFYFAKDLICGQFIDVLTRKLLLESCDQFTKSYYLDELGIKQPTVKIPKSSPSKKREMVKSLPPYNGFGSEKDSLANCLHLIPKPVKQDLKQFLKNEGKKLQFVAKFTNPNYGDEDRRFVITYFMGDDTCEIFEPAKNTPGIMGGKFLERGKYKKPVRKVKRQQEVSRELKNLQQTVQEKIKSKMIGGPFGLLRAFRQFAINENCMIDQEGFRVGLRTIGILEQTATEHLIEELFSLYDKTGDGQIDFQEFVDNVMEERIKPTNTSEYAGRALRASDLFVGAKLRLLFPQTGACSPEFSILKATRQTLALMESKEHVSEFPKSNVEVILKNLAVALREFHIDVGQLFRKLDHENKGYVDVAVFGNLIKQFARDCGITDDPLSEHEVLTLTRIYDTTRDGKIDFKEFSAALKQSVEIVDKVKEEADKSEKEASEAFQLCVSTLLTKLHSTYDQSTLIYKFSAHCRSHKYGIPKDLFLFFLTDEVGCDVAKEFGVELMLHFDLDCDGRISLNDFINSLYKQEDTGDVERDVMAFLKLNKKQSYFNKPGFPEYITLLRSAQIQTFTSHITLEKLVKAFTSAFFKRRKYILKGILNYDYQRKGYIEKIHFLKLLKETNFEYPKTHLDLLSKYLFKDSSKLEYNTCLSLFFSQNYKELTNLYGEIPQQN